MSYLHGKRSGTKNNKWTASEYNLKNIPYIEFPRGLAAGVLKFYTLLTASASLAKIIFFLNIWLTGRALKTDAQSRDFAELKIPNNLIEHFPVMA